MLYRRVFLGVLHQSCARKPSERQSSRIVPRRSGLYSRRRNGVALPTTTPSVWLPVVDAFRTLVACSLPAIIEVFQQIQTLASA